ncbi:MAG: CbbQ/NirQ/NorQ/GpvN family protein [bacterium]|nr:CbbQ/NirQ/NorQ/GpvN family protein [bacterium]
MPLPANEETLPYYRPVDREIEVFEAAASQRLALLLKGPTGSGKSRFIEYMAARMGRRLVTVTCHDETAAVDLLGRHLIVGGDTVWQDGPLTAAVREGAILYLDEIAEARPDVIVAIHSLTDHRRSLYLDRRGEEITASPEFMLVASFNPGYQRGIKELKPSTRQRFIALGFEYPQPAVEEEILIGETGIDRDRASRLVRLAGKIRGLSELALTETVSTRLLVDAASLMAGDLPPRLSCRVAIVEPLSDDPDTVAGLTDLAALFF